MIDSINSRAVRKSDNFIDIAQCLYLTDPYIYPSAFGKDNDAAANAILALMDIQNCVLHYKNFFVVMDGNKICGILLYNEHGAVWEASNYYPLIKDYIPSEKNFIFVSKQYFEVEAEKPPDNHIELIAVCVSPSYRNKGIASAMLKAFIQEKKGKTLELDVLADNDAAIRLYSRLGFSVTEKLKGFHLDEAQRPDCFHMIKE